MSTNDQYSIKEINSTLLQLESDFGLLERQAAGVYYWERVRHPIHEQILSKLENNDDDSKEKSHIGGTNDIERYAQRISDGIINIINKNPYFSEKSDILFYGKGRRRQLDNGAWYDIHLDPIAEIIGSNYTFIEPKRGPPEAASENRRFLVLPRLMGDIAQKLGYTYTLPEKEQNVLREFENVIKTKFAVDIDVISKIEWSLSSRRARLPFMSQIVKRINPDLCFMTYGHSQHSTFVEACHNHGVTTVDVQYCAVDPNYWPYHYPGDRTRRVKTDYMFLWGEFWKEAADLPFSEDEVYITGFPYLERQLERYVDTDKKEQVLFISNSKSGPLLSKFATELADTDMQKEIVYKLHGGEFDTWRSDYPELAEAAKQEKIIVLDKIEGSLHELLAESRAQVGVSSTAIYEGLGFNLPTYILDVPYAYEMQSLTEAGYAELVDDAQDLASKLGSPDTIRPETNIFFREGSQKHFYQALSAVK